jgi:acylphosphatase
MTSRRIVVRGLVQGVGFRWSAMLEAQRLGLTGWVRNVPDGSVELSIHGDQSAVLAMLDWLHKGPPGARIESLGQHDDPDPAPTRFEIRT